MKYDIGQKVDIGTENNPLIVVVVSDGDTPEEGVCLDCDLKGTSLSLCTYCDCAEGGYHWEVEK